MRVFKTCAGRVGEQKEEFLLWFCEVFVTINTTTGEGMGRWSSIYWWSDVSKKKIAFVCCCEVFVTTVTTTERGAALEPVVMVGFSNNRGSQVPGQVQDFWHFWPVGG